MNGTEPRHIKAARKHHQCSWCCGLIAKGFPYLRSRGFDGGDAWTWKAHPECDAAAAWAYGPGGLPDGAEVSDASSVAAYLEIKWINKLRRFDAQPTEGT